MKMNWRRLNMGGGSLGFYLAVPVPLRKGLKMTVTSTMFLRFSIWVDVICEKRKEKKRKKRRRIQDAAAKRPEMR